MQMPRSTAIIYPKDIAAILIWADIYPVRDRVRVGHRLGRAHHRVAARRRTPGPGHCLRAAARVRRAGAHERGGLPRSVPQPDHPRTRRLPGHRRARSRPRAPRPARALAGHPLRRRRRCGRAGSYPPTLPSTTQVQTTVQTLRAYGFGDVETIETLYRPWHVQGQSVPPGPADGRPHRFPHLRPPPQRPRDPRRRIASPIQPTRRTHYPQSLQRSSRATRPLARRGPLTWHRPLR